MSDNPDPRRPPALLPAAGPAWAGSLMGVSISSTLLGIYGVDLVALAFLLLAWTIFFVVTIGWIRYRTPRFEVAVMPAWGMVAMGVISLGSATSALLGGPAWRLHLGFWLAGTVLGVIACLRFSRALFTGRAGSPTFSWGLPLVAPMVAATAGMQVHEHLLLIDAPATLLAAVLTVCGALFLMALLLAVPVFGYVYLQIIGPSAKRSGTDLFPPMAAPTAWIPLGVIGQSTAAAQFLARGFGWQGLGIGYGVVMLLAGIPLASWALWRHYRVAWRIRYSPTWWSSTFPVGTCCLGSHTLAIASGVSWLNVASAGLLLLLLVHVAWAGSGFLRAVGRRALG